MSIARFLFFLSSALLFPLTVSAQICQGYITDNRSEPLAGISVRLRDEAHKTVGFARSDAEGNFSVRPQHGKTAVNIAFSMIGFENLSMALSDFKNGQRIILKEKAYELKEVKVKPTRIRKRGDTLTYSVATFKEKQDRSIADVIARMPGMTVSEDGSIEYQGQKINKFYVEGMDLLGGKYAQASENLSADKVSNVQVMENHQPVKALHGVSFSDQAALNIVLKEGAKNVWNGAADIGTGLTCQGETEWLRDCRLTEMFFSRRMQSVSLYKCNNTGKDILHEISDLGDRESSVYTEGGVLSNISLSAPQLEKRRSLFNDTHVGATNWLLKTAHDNDLRLQLTAVFDRNRMSRYSEKQYTDVADGQIITEDETATGYKSEYTGQLMYKVNKEQLYMTNTIKGYADFNRSCGTSLFNGQQTDLSVKPRKRYVADHFEMIRQTKGKSSFSVSSNAVYNYLPAMLLISDGSMQHINLQTVNGDASVAFRHHLMGFLVTWRTGFKLEHQDMYVDSISERYHEWRIFAAPTVNYQHGQFKCSGTVPVSYLHRTYDGTAKGKLTAEPSIYARYEWNAHLAANFNYMLTYHPDDIKGICHSPYYTTYITRRQGSGYLDAATSQFAGMRIEYKDIMLGLFANLNVSWNQQAGIRLYESLLKDGIYTRMATDRETDINSYTLQGKVTESFGSHGISIGFNGNASWTSYEMMNNGEPVPAKFRTISLALTYSYRPWTFLSFDGKSAYEYVKQTGSVASFHHKLSTFLSFGRWQAEWSNDCYHSNDESVSFNFFADATLTYKTSAFDISLEWSNIFGNQNYERRIITSTTSLFTVNQLRPSEILAKISFDF